MWHILPLHESLRKVSCQAGCAKYNWLTFLGNDNDKTTSIFRVEVKEFEKFGHDCKRKISPTL